MISGRTSCALPARASLRRVARASGNRPIPLGGNYGSQKASRAGAVAVGWRAGSTAPARFTERGLERLVPDRLLGMAVGPRQLDLRLPGPDDPSRGSTPGTRGRSPAEWRWVPLCRARDDELERYPAALRRRACTEPPCSLALLRHAKPSARTNDCKCPARGAQRRASGEREYARMASDCLPGG